MHILDNDIIIINFWGILKSHYGFVCHKDVSWCNWLKIWFKWMLQKPFYATYKAIKDPHLIGSSNLTLFSRISWKSAQKTPLEPKLRVFRDPFVNHDQLSWNSCLIEPQLNFIIKWFPFLNPFSHKWSSLEWKTELMMVYDEDGKEKKSLLNWVLNNLQFSKHEREWIEYHVKLRVGNG